MQKMNRRNREEKLAREIKRRHDWTIDMETMK